MSMFPQSQTRKIELEYGTDNRVVFNFFNAVYGWMAAGLAVTAGVAYLCSQTPVVLQTIASLGYFGVIAIVLAMWGLAYAAQKAAIELNATVGTLLYLLYAALVGALISWIFLVYSASTLLGAFVMTGGVFAAMSVYGFVTKRDLSTIGSYLVMAVFGLIAASIVNVFLASDALSWIITYAVLAVFIGLTAYHTQQLRDTAVQIGNNGELASRYAVVGSIILYIAFINMFMSILRIFGSRDE